MKSLSQLGPGSLPENSPLSALFTNLGPGGSRLAIESFGSWPRLSIFLPCRQSPDYALNPGSRPETLPNRKFFSRKRGGLAQSTPQRGSGSSKQLGTGTIYDGFWSLGRGL